MRTEDGGELGAYSEVSVVTLPSRSNVHHPELYSSVPVTVHAWALTDTATRNKIAAGVNFLIIDLSFARL